MTTERLNLTPLTPGDAGFVLQLVNTKGWIEFIGDRNVHTIEEAVADIHKTLGSEHVRYWVVRLKENGVPMGVVTRIQRSYLLHPDVGFAFLPQYTGKGYAYEAAAHLIQQLQTWPGHAIILATCAPHNGPSARLLKKLGFAFVKEFEVDNKHLHLYSLPALTNNEEVTVLPDLVNK